MVSEISVGGLIFFEENKKRKYLLLEYERINDEKGEHKYWDFPKGHVEKNEKETDTLFREIKEETGLTNIDLVLGFKEKLKYFFKKEGNLISKEVIYYLLKSNIKEVNISSEHTDFKWFEYEEALKEIEFKSSKDMLKKAETFINSSLINYE